MIERHEKVPERAVIVSQTKHTALLPHVNLWVNLTAPLPSLKGLGGFGEQASRIYRFAALWESLHSFPAPRERIVPAVGLAVTRHRFRTPFL